MSWSCLRLYLVPLSLACHVLYALSYFCASFSLSSYTPHASSFILVHIFFFFSLIPLDSFVYSWQKRGGYTWEYTGEYRHFYMTHMHILRGKNSTSCTFVRGESLRGDAYTKGEKTFFFRKPCFICFTLCLLSRCFMVLWVRFSIYALLLSLHHVYDFMCWTCIHPYTIVFYWLHVWMIICFARWSL